MFSNQSSYHTVSPFWIIMWRYLGISLVIYIGHALWANERLIRLISSNNAFIDLQKPHAHLTTWHLVCNTIWTDMGINCPMGDRRQTHYAACFKVHSEKLSCARTNHFGITCQVCSSHTPNHRQSLISDMYNNSTVPHHSHHQEDCFSVSGSLFDVSQLVNRCMTLLHIA